MGLDEFDRVNRHEQFVEAITGESVGHDDSESRAHTYVVGSNHRVWYHHAAKKFAGVSKRARERLTSTDNRQLVHLFVLASKTEFRTFVEAHEEDLTKAATNISWYALPDEFLGEYSTAGSSDKFNVNEKDFDEMRGYRHDGHHLFG